jgi:hypothetical protein
LDGSNPRFGQYLGRTQPKPDRVAVPKNAVSSGLEYVCVGELPLILFFCALGTAAPALDAVTLSSPSAFATSPEFSGRIIARAPLARAEQPTAEDTSFFRILALRAVRPVGVLVFIEGIAWFLLRQYRPLLQTRDL